MLGRIARPEQCVMMAVGGHAHLADRDEAAVGQAGEGFDRSGLGPGDDFGPGPARLHPREAGRIAADRLEQLEPDPIAVARRIMGHGFRIPGPPGPVPVLRPYRQRRDEGAAAGAAGPDMEAHQHAGIAQRQYLARSVDQQRGYAAKARIVAAKLPAAQIGERADPAAIGIAAVERHRPRRHQQGARPHGGGLGGRRGRQQQDRKSENDQDSTHRALP